jgi:RNA-binding protein 5/10
MSPQIHPSGFRISDKPVAASFAHQYSFQPVDHMLRDETAIPSSINLGGVEGAFVKYWDDSAMVAVLEFKVEEPVQPQVQPSAGPVKEKKEKKKKGTLAKYFLFP